MSWVENFLKINKRLFETREYYYCFLVKDSAYLKNTSISGGFKHSQQRRATQTTQKCLKSGSFLMKLDNPTTLRKLVYPLLSIMILNPNYAK